jgi:hypothetical protein
LSIHPGGQIGQTSAVAVGQETRFMDSASNLARMICSDTESGGYRSDAAAVGQPARYIAVWILDLKQFRDVI